MSTYFPTLLLENTVSPVSWAPSPTVFCILPNAWLGELAANFWIQWSLLWHVTLPVSGLYGANHPKSCGNASTLFPGYKSPFVFLLPHWFLVLNYCCCFFFISPNSQVHIFELSSPKTLTLLVASHPLGLNIPAAWWLTTVNLLPRPLHWTQSYIFLWYVRGISMNTCKPYYFSYDFPQK